MKRTIIFILLGIAVLAAAGCTNGGEVRVTDAWARPADAGGTTAVYFVIDNPAGEADELLDVSGTAAAALEMHLSSMDENGVASMRRQESVPIPAGETTVFEPGGLHVMLIDVAAPLAPGDTLTIRLEFRDAGEIELEVPVREP